MTTTYAWCLECAAVGNERDQAGLQIIRFNENLIVKYHTLILTFPQHILPNTVTQFLKNTLRP